MLVSNDRDLNDRLNNLLDIAKAVRLLRGRSEGERAEVKLHARLSSGLTRGTLDRN
jgi:hypothetical protein